MQNPLFQVKGPTRIVYSGKEVCKNPQASFYTRSTVLSDGQKHGKHTVLREFVEFGEKVVEASDWVAGELSGKWEASSSTGERLVGRFVNGKAEGKFCLSGTRNMTLFFHEGLLKWWDCGENTKLSFLWDEDRLIINPGKEKFKVSMSKKKREGQIGHLLFYCLSLYGKTLLNKKGVAFVVHFDGQLYRIPCFPKRLDLQKMLWVPRWHETVYSAIKDMWSDHLAMQQKKWMIKKV
ncbi:hypothetical protein GMAR_ORF60 [Golden Marseillevirus]|uniref:hypothetical protein n=1 Tax=Golden Marseillevirus TaxID=1720526 RepID=UPI000877AAE1|nr:hypothetical protein GMAR_ORF60 [Golden Marseillevirus]ALX27435.1 hypothetical protein GMAR_ORF60 [Golden Marseillevirus]